MTIATKPGWVYTYAMQLPFIKFLQDHMTN